jgi:hypothetical protein
VVHLDHIEDWQQLRIVPGLARREHDRQRLAMAINGQVDLHAQPAVGPTDRSLDQPARRSQTSCPPFPRTDRMLRARTTVESTLTTQSIGRPLSWTIAVARV